MSDQPKTMPPKHQESTPRSRQVFRVMTATTIGAALLVTSALTLTGTVVALILSTPVLVICSPILVPAATVFFLITVGFLFSGSCGLAAIAALTWIYNYVAGKNPPGAEQLDYARMKIASTAREAKEKAKEHGHHAHEQHGHHPQHKSSNQQQVSS